jgi:hypothetical protein
LTQNLKSEKSILKLLTVELPEQYKELVLLYEKANASYLVVRAYLRVVTLLCSVFAYLKEYDPSNHAISVIKRGELSQMLGQTWLRASECLEENEKVMNDSFCCDCNLTTNKKID